MALTDLKIRAAKPQPKPYHLTDGRRLFLVVQPNNSKLWRWKYRFEGNFRLMALGRYPGVSLADARAAHATARAKLTKGVDPMFERKAGKTVELRAKRRVEAQKNGDVQNPFRDVAAVWFVK